MVTGHVLAVEGSEARIGLESLPRGPDRPTVGKFVAIKGHDTTLVGMISEVSLRPEELNGSRTVARVDLLGEIERTAGGGSRFRRGVREYAAIGDPAEMIGREELLSAVWPGVVVGDDALTQAIIKLRKALGDDAQEPRYIETIPKRGYRLIAPVQAVADPRPPGAPEDAKKRNRTSLLVVGLALALLLGLAGQQLLTRPWPLAPDAGPKPPAASFPLVAVLPLANLSGDPKRDYLIFGSIDGFLYILNRKTGHLVKHFKCEGGIWSTPLIHENKVYFTSTDKRVRCLDLDTFSLIFEKNLDYTRIFSSPTIINGRLYVGTNAARLHELDPMTGEETGYFQTR